jgi:hypothetical protein
VDKHPPAQNQCNPPQPGMAIIKPTHRRCGEHALRPGGPGVNRR